MHVMCVGPSPACGQQMNSDAAQLQIQVPASCRNKDLKRLMSLALQKAPPAALPLPEPSSVAGVGCEAIPGVGGAATVTGRSQPPG
jgi:hypothetical protein